MFTRTIFPHDASSESRGIENCKHASTCKCTPLVAYRYKCIDGCFIAIRVVILTHSLKFIRGQACSYYFNDADSNGGNSFRIIMLLWVANRHRKFGFFGKNKENLPFFKHSTHRWTLITGINIKKMIQFQCVLRS